MPDINPGEGYRLLRTGERLKAGDEFYYSGFSQILADHEVRYWVVVPEHAIAEVDYTPEFHYPFRRKIEPRKVYSSWGSASTWGLGWRYYGDSSSSTDGYFTVTNTIT